MPPRRARQVQRGPRGDLTGFPRVRRRPPEVWRAGLASFPDPWWWSASGEGRFDVQALGLGTLYVGTDPLVGLLEVLGPEMLNGAVKDTDLGKLDISSARTKGLSWGPLAELTSAAAVGYNVNNTLSTMTPYTVPQRWACALQQAGFTGIRYRTRFDVRPAPRGLALFGAAGSNTASWPVDSRAPASSLTARLRAECNITILATPFLSSLPAAPTP